MIEDQVEKARIKLGFSFALLTQALEQYPQLIAQLTGAAKPTQELTHAMDQLLLEYDCYKADVLLKFLNKDTLSTIELARALHMSEWNLSQLIHRSPDVLTPAGQRPKQTGKRNVENYFTREQVERLFEYNSACLINVQDSRRVGPLARWFLEYRCSKEPTRV